ncbi:glycine--tRNA ligase subunit beta [Crenobacter sp. SG2303]|uniref:Glycine--tRNA ligase beta subunit n=1 Tax=Crenobacter oryzisoli TaxID=3056844 RepID=A0ABT7XM86_9NEIS|nr:glycine--tRNA ligase subunit beta [Crenobacter sp. SG2303]MDN0074891.1 glycine--tRNA ligase subunit beta [Crenobacter sp. SG2303]
MNATLLIELLTEELPPKALPQLAASFADTISDELRKLQFAAADANVHVFASPRRLAVQIAGVLALQPDQHIVKKGPSLAAGMKDGVPTKALEGFARSCGVSVDELTVSNDGKQDVYAYESTKTGEPLSAALSDIVASALKKLPVPKLMRWSDLDHQFVRPVHGLIMLHGDQVVPGEVLGLKSGNATRGHRFLSQGEVVISHADQYPVELFEQGKVVASFDTRRSLIRHRLDKHAADLGATIAADDALIDEVTALVEWPVVLEAGFEAEFLRVPQECLILTMQQNQKYFPLLDGQGKLMNRFLLVSNLEAADPSNIIHGNERVLRARLSDAKFFFEQDQKHRLDTRLSRLAHVVYHNKIGTVLERVERLQAIAGGIAAQLGADQDRAESAAYLAKADLVTDMVGEFPELQGVMGMYYALHDGHDPEVAAAIEGHYHPRFAGDTLPVGPIATAVALADKLETLVGIWGIGLIPTGDKDPFALRRAALGVLRMLLESPLSLKALLKLVAEVFPAGKLAANTADELYGFMLERLRNLLRMELLEEGSVVPNLAAQHAFAQEVHAQVNAGKLSTQEAGEMLAGQLSGNRPVIDLSVIDAVLAQTPDRLDEVRAVLAAVAEFKRLPEAATLAAANKRVKNILKKAEGEVGAVNPALFAEAAETALHQAVEALAPQVEAKFAAHDFTAALSLLAGLKAPVDAFFDGVMVMADDAAVRANRIALLARLSALFNRVADISLLAE